MAAVSETIVREYFELNGFLVRQFRKYVAPAGREDDDIDFLVLNPYPESRSSQRAFLLESADLPGIERAIIVVKAWHSDVFTPALLNHAPDFFRFLEKRTFKQAVNRFAHGGALLKILAVPALPQDTHARNESIAILRARGLDGALSFRRMLSDLVNQVEPNRNYQKSDLLQIFRILKTYEFLRDPQLDLFRPKRKRTSRKQPADPSGIPPAEPKKAASQAPF